MGLEDIGLLGFGEVKGMTLSFFVLRTSEKLKNNLIKLYEGQCLATMVMRDKIFGVSSGHEQFSRKIDKITAKRRCGDHISYFFQAMWGVKRLCNTELGCRDY